MSALPLARMADKQWDLMFSLYADAVTDCGYFVTAGCAATVSALIMPAKAGYVDGTTVKPGYEMIFVRTTYMVADFHPIAGDYLLEWGTGRRHTVKAGSLDATRTCWKLYCERSVETTGDNFSPRMPNGPIVDEGVWWLEDAATGFYGVRLATAGGVTTLEVDQTSTGVPNAVGTSYAKILSSDGLYHTVTVVVDGFGTVALEISETGTPTGQATSLLLLSDDGHYYRVRCATADGSTYMVVDQVYEV